MGGQGVGNNLRNFYREPDAQVLAVCDVFKNRADRARNEVNKKYGNTDCKAYTDFREIIADDAIDAVVISTPDHWHVPMSMLALKAGKDVFCEKPTFCIAEGRALIDAVKKQQAIFQVGLEDRSLIRYHNLVEWLRNGAIGSLERIHVALPCGIKYPLSKPAPVPDDLDYNLFVGPAPFEPYTQNSLAIFVL